MKKRLLFIAPHLSTGGMPQYLYKQILNLIEHFEIYCIEWSDITGGVLIIQKNKIQRLLGDNLFTLGENKEIELFNIIKDINPNYIHLQECPEYFIDYNIAKKLYSIDRKYTIIETSHDSSFNIDKKLHFPDKFMMVSQYQVEKFNKINIPTELVEYPIEYKDLKNKEKNKILEQLGLDPNKKHIVNVGLFTPRKNQAEIIEYAKKLKDYPIQFHFIGNQADNFQYYWEPLMKDFPSNCKWWGEQDEENVSLFYSIADLFLFTSRGNENDKETMPLVIREAIGWHIPSLIYNLDVYLNYFDKFENIDYLDFSNFDENCNKILKKLNLIKNNFDDYFNVSFVKEENKINLDYKKKELLDVKVSIKEKNSNAPLYWFEAKFENNCSWWVIPCPVSFFNFWESPYFGTILIEFYDRNDNLLFSKDLFIKDVKEKAPIKLNLKNNFDCLYNNYNEMFLEKKYDCYNLENLDVVFDIGANSGLFSLMLLEKNCKKVYAFEPNKTSLTNLKSIINSDKLEIIEKAVYISDEDLEFYIDPANTTIGSIKEEHLLTGQGIEKITVPAISLNTFVKEKNINHISLIKMDIEGAEYDIIDNLEDEIFDITERFLIEWHDNNDKRLNKLIKKLINNNYIIEQIRDQNSLYNDDVKNDYENRIVGTLFAVKSKKPKLTVIIPTYNHENYVKDCIDSVLKQKTLFKFRIIMSDDCSTDKTWDIIQNYNVNLFKNYNISSIIRGQTNNNIGAVSLRTKMLLEGIDSDYITFLDGDDYYTDEYKLQKQVDFLEQNKDYIIHSTGHYVSKEDSIAYNNSEPSELFLHSLKEDVTLLDNLERNFISFGFMFRNILREKSFFKENWFLNENIFDGYWALINFLLCYGKAKNEKWVGGRYRITPKGAFGEKTEEWKQEQIKKQSLYLIEVFKNKNIKPILIVDAFFHDKHCLDVFKNYLSFIKELNIPIMLITNSEFDSSLIKEVDYILYDSNNRLFEKEYKDIDNIVFWFSGPYYISLGTKGFQKHGLSVLSNLYHSTNLAKSLGYTHFFRIEYDCIIEKVSNIKNMIDETLKNNKKGIIYVNEEKYASFQIWYFELDYFTKNFPQINNEEDYIEKKKLFNYHKDFISAEEFILNMIKKSEGGESNIIIKEAKLMHTDFGNCYWNTVMTPLESNKIVDGFISSLHRVVKYNGKTIPENSPIDKDKVAFITWNCSSSNKNKGHAYFKIGDNEWELIHEIEEHNDNKIQIIKIFDDVDLEVKIVLNDKITKYYKINKNNVHTLEDVYAEYN